MDIRDKLNEFKYIINEHHTKEEWFKIKKDLEEFISEKHVTQEELKDFINSRAGEMLNMICSAYDYETLKNDKEPIS